MKRKIDLYLHSWKRDSNRKPLIVRGARQVGKTYSVRQFGKTYQSFVEINFVTHPEFKGIFAQGFSVDTVIGKSPFLILHFNLLKMIHLFFSMKYRSLQIVSHA